MIVFKKSRRGNEKNKRTKREMVAMHAASNILLSSLTKFYKNASHERAFLKILKPPKGEQTISLRVIDWLVTNYAKRYNVIFTNIRGCAINMHGAYKTELATFSKQYFDPFCRRNRITFTMSSGARVDTTLGQLNFFRWAISQGVIRFAEDKKQAIEQDMSNTLSKIRKKKSNGVAHSGARPKRSEIYKPNNSIRTIKRGGERTKMSFR